MADVMNPLRAARLLDADKTCTASVAQNPAASITVRRGGSQQTPVLAAFASSLDVRVADAGDVPLSGLTVNFSVPMTGASAVLSSTSAVTDVNGIASITATANATAGSYAAQANVAGVATPASFALTNTAFAATLELAVLPATVAFGGSATLTATVTGTGPLVPTGTVDFLVDGQVVCNAVMLDGSGIATCVAGPFAPGVHALTANYSDDDAHAGAANAQSVSVTALAAPAPIPAMASGSMLLLMLLIGMVAALATHRR